MTRYHHLAAGLLPFVLEAGRGIMQHFGSEKRSREKGDGSPVTAADLESESVILRGLAAIAPDTPVISEEAAHNGVTPDIGSEFFLVDPLDGTREFIGGRPEFTINIGLVRERTPVFGLVYAPAGSRLYVTLAIDEAYLIALSTNASAADLGALEKKRIRVRPADDTSRLVVCASRSHRNPELETFLARFSDAESLEVGSSLKFCMVAEGRADFYPRLGPTKEWDTAAGHSVLAAAGGQVTRLDGTPLHYGKSGDDYLNPKFIAFGSRYRSFGTQEPRIFA
jgi:3'(2'), 5'-bisphosphate nucleotidase